MNQFFTAAVRSTNAAADVARFMLIAPVVGYQVMRSGLLGSRPYVPPANLPSDADTVVNSGLFSTTVTHSWYDTEKEAKMRKENPIAYWEDIEGAPPWFCHQTKRHFFPVTLPSCLGKVRDSKGLPISIIDKVF